MDKTNLLRKVAELDDAVKTVAGTRNTHPAPQSSKTKACLHNFLFFTTYHLITNPFLMCHSLLQDKGDLNMGTVGFRKRLSQPERRLSRFNDEPSRFREFAGNNSQG